MKVPITGETQVQFLRRGACKVGINRTTRRQITTPTIPKGKRLQGFKK